MDSSSKKIFIIHGHDERNLQSFKELLGSKFGLIPVVLKEEPHKGGETIIEKFERLAQECCYAVVLLTPDDHVRAGSKWWFWERKVRVWQPRPNVVFELGWFCGALGRDGILWLCKEGTILPSDFHGVLQVVFQHSVAEVVEKVDKQLRLRGIIG